MRTPTHRPVGEGHLVSAGRDAFQTPLPHPFVSHLNPIERNATQQLNAYLFFDGTCADAMRFYERVLGGKIDMMMTHAESPVADQAPAGNADRILHAALRLGDQMLLASDAMAGQTYEGMKGFAVSFGCPTAAEAKRVFGLLAEGGRVTMPMEKSFWAAAFGMLTDKFGTPWTINGAMTRG